MGKLINLHELRLNPNEWMIPKTLVTWDRRQQSVWPNDLFPAGCTLDIAQAKDHDAYAPIKLRRWIEQTCLGDVAIELTICYIFWFQFPQDCLKFCLAWQPWILTHQGIVLDIKQ